MPAPKLHNRQELMAAATALGNALISCEKYAVVGGAACALLGSTRTTQDIDVVVPRGATVSTRQLLRSSHDFLVEARTNHTWYRAQTTTPVQIEILAPPVLFQENFDQQTEVVTIGNVNVLKPALLLNVKCGSILSRSSDSKRRTDSEDIKFILSYCAQNRTYLPKASEVPRATQQFVHWYIQSYGGQDLWVQAGYNLETGSF